MAVYRGYSGSILYNEVIIGAVADWQLMIVQRDNGARWAGSLTWQWLSLNYRDPNDDEFRIELQDGAENPSYRLSGITVFTALDWEKNRLEFRGMGDLDGIPDPGPGQSEIAIT